MPSLSGCVVVVLQPLVVFKTLTWPLLPLNALCSTAPHGGGMYNVIMYLAGLSLDELNSQFSLQPPAEGVHKWIVPAERGVTKTILIREHYKQMLKALYTSARLPSVGTCLSEPEVLNSKALLRGTPGTGRSTLMLVVFIELLKMLKSPNDAEGTDIFFPKVQSLVLQWSSLCKGAEVVVGNRAHYKDTVHLYDAGENLPRLPGEEYAGFVIAAASTANPDLYLHWASKACPRYHFNLLWSWPEVKCLWELTRERLKFHMSLEDLRERYCLVGGIPGMIFEIKDLRRHVETTVSTLAANQLIRMQLNRGTIGKVDLTTSEGHSIFALAVPGTARKEFDKAEVRWPLCGLAWLPLLLLVVAGVDLARGSCQCSCCVLVWLPGSFICVNHSPHAMCAEMPQLKFMSPAVANLYFWRQEAGALVKLHHVLGAAVTLGGAEGGYVFASLCMYWLSKRGIRATGVVLHPTGEQEQVAVEIRPDVVHYFVDVDHLQALVAAHCGRGIYVPAVSHNPMVDMWAAGTVTGSGRAGARAGAGSRAGVALLASGVCAVRCTTSLAHESIDEEAAQAQRAVFTRQAGSWGDSLPYIWMVPGGIFENFTFQRGKHERPGGSRQPVFKHRQVKVAVADGRAVWTGDRVLDLAGASVIAMTTLQGIGEASANLVQAAITKAGTTIATPQQLMGVIKAASVRTRLMNCKSSWCFRGQLLPADYQVTTSKKRKRR